MSDAIPSIKKRPRGRPRTDATPVMVRLSPEQVAALDQWIAAIEPSWGRPAGIRALIERELIKREDA